jgi:hypothetical protein
MPDLKDQIGDLASSVGQSEPVLQIAKGISDVGQKASDTYDAAKGWVKKKVQQLTPTTSPPPITTDIELPKAGKKKITRPLPVRSLSKR